MTTLEVLMNIHKLGLNRKWFNLRWQEFSCFNFESGERNNNIPTQTVLISRDNFYLYKEIFEKEKVIGKKCDTQLYKLDNYLIQRIKQNISVNGFHICLVDFTDGSGIYNYDNKRTKVYKLF